MSQVGSPPQAWLLPVMPLTGTDLEAPLLAAADHTGEVPSGGGVEGKLLTVGRTLIVCSRKAEWRAEEPRGSCELVIGPHVWVDDSVAPTRVGVRVHAYEPH